MPTIYVLSGGGDQRVSWDRDRAEARDPEALAAIAEAEAIFARELAKGGSAFKVTREAPAERMRKFDRTADEIVIIPRMAGG